MERSHPSPSHTADFKCLTSIRVDRFISFIIYQLHKVQKECSLFGWKKWEDIIFRTPPPKKTPPPLSFPVCLASSVILFILLVLFFFFPPKANYLFPKMQSIVISSFYEMWWWWRWSWRWGEGMPCACMRPRCTFKWCSELSWYYPCVFIISVHPRAFPCVLTNAAP